MSLKEVIACQRHQSVAHAMLSVQILHCKAVSTSKHCPPSVSVPKLYKESCRCNVTQTSCSCLIEQVLAARKQLYQCC